MARLARHEFIDPNEVSQRSNPEEDESGRFWQDRFGLIKLMDEESLLACMAYVDLNPIRAAMAETLEDSNFTSVQRRIESLPPSQPDSAGTVPQ